MSGLAGTLFYDSEDTQLSAENDFYMVTISVGFGCAGIDGNTVGFLPLEALELTGLLLMVNLHGCKPNFQIIP